VTSPQRILNCIPSRKVELDWNAADARAAAPIRARTVPANKDLRDASWPVSDQGETGACVGFASADSVLRWHFATGGFLQLEELLSTRYVWMAAKEVDEFVTRPTGFIDGEGTSLKAALDVARKFGVVRDGLLPFDGQRLYRGEARDFYAKASQLMISSYFNLGNQLGDWREWLAYEGPILTRLDVDRTWDQASQTAGELAEYQPLTVRGGHAVAIVGYDESGFIIRNSWGTTWGKDGFAHASEAYASAAFTEAYGVRL